MVTQDFPWRTVTTNVLDGLVHEGRSNNRGVLFVHGFNGDALTTWREQEGVANFAELIYTDPRLEDYDVFRFNYRTGMWAGDDVRDVAKQLQDRLKSNELNKYQLILIAHSMGGLVSMRCILDFLKYGHQPNIIGLMLYGTPTNGADWIRIAKVFAKALGFKVPWAGGILSSWMSSHRQLVALERASDFVQALNAEWAFRVINGGNQAEDTDRRILMPVKVIVGTKDNVVPVDSAKGNYGEIDFLPIPFGHIKLVKPRDHKDPRYQAAQEFLEKCRHEKPPEVLLRLRQSLDEIWKTQYGKLIRDWHYEVHINRKGREQHTELALAGFAPCAVTRCEYRTILDRDALYVGVTYGRTAAKQAWNVEPCYVHQIIPDSILQPQRDELCAAVDKVTLESPDVCWQTFFPQISVGISAYPNPEKYELSPADVTSGENRLIRRFNVPGEAHHLLRKEVTLSIKYESVAPRALTNFNLFFPWLTDGCNAQITVHDDVEFLLPVFSLANHSAVLIDTETSKTKGIVLFRTKEVLLPNSSVEVRWQRKQKESN
jgi:pimeloyl-ACP methyl ester carboxylesterase